VGSDYEVYRDISAVLGAAADEVVRRSREAARLRGSFALAVSADSRAKQVLGLLADDPRRDLVPWDSLWVVAVGGDPTGAASEASSESVTAPTVAPGAEMAPMVSQLPLGSDRYFEIAEGARLPPGVGALLAGSAGGVGGPDLTIVSLRPDGTVDAPAEDEPPGRLVVLVTGEAAAAALADARASGTDRPARSPRPMRDRARWLIDRAGADASRALLARTGASSSAPTDPGRTARRRPADGASDAEELKAVVGRRAAELVRSGDRVGLGTGSTARHVVLGLADRLRRGDLTDVVGVPTSRATEELARENSVPVASLDEQPRLDLTIDGADEIAPNIDLVKGLGGALLREKIVAAASERMIVVADESKLVDLLGTIAPVPVAVTPFAWRSHARSLRQLGCEPALRTDASGAPYVTDDGLYLLDCRFAEGVADPRLVERTVCRHPGIVESGLFLGMADTALVSDPAGVMIYHR